MHSCTGGGLDIRALEGKGTKGRGPADPRPSEAGTLLYCVIHSRPKFEEGLELIAVESKDFDANRLMLVLGDSLIEAGRNTQFGGTARRFICVYRAIMMNRIPW